MIARSLKQQWLKKGVQAKITLGLVTVALLVVIVGSLGIWSSYRIARLSEKIATHSAPALLNAEEMKSQTLRLQRDLLSYTLLRADRPYNNKTMQEMDQVIADHRSAKNAFYEALDKHYRLYTFEDHRYLKRHEQVSEAFGRYWSYANDLINESQLDNLAVAEHRLNQVEDDLLAAIDAIIRHESNAIIDIQSTLQALTSNLTLLNISVIITSLLLALGIAYYTSKTIVEPILALEAAAVRLGKGSFLSKTRPLKATHSKDEIGVLARAFSDMSDNLQRLNSDLKHNANHDVLTGLANRKYLLEALEEHLEHVNVKPQHSALLFLDFDRFKTVNDYYGHQVGDSLLAAVSLRLRETVRNHDLIARLGGDEFTILLTHMDTPVQAEKMAARLLQNLRRPFQVDGIELRMTASIGIVLIGETVRSAADILRDADIAMYRAKAKGAGRFEVFTESLRQETFLLMELENDLRQALEEGSLSVHYQPIVALSSEQIVGTEALVRWHHPERGPVYPEQFIPIAEETGLIGALDRFVLREACVQTAHWNERFDTRLSISVNVSGQQFASHSLVQDVRDVLSQTGLDPKLLHLEITETILMRQTEFALDSIKALKTLGVTLHMDDFGTGYSSLAYLQYFDVDTLKIDRSFISAMLESPESGTLVHTILVMAKSLNLAVIAEGVETAEQADHLRSLNCELAQGYLFSRPQGAQDLEAYLLKTLCPITEPSSAETGGPELNL